MDFDDLLAEAEELAEVALPSMEGEKDLIEELADAENAIPPLRKALETHPDSFAVALLLGLFLKLTGSIGEAAYILSKATKLRPDDPRPYFWLADAYWNAARADMYGPLEAERRKALADLVLSDPELRQALPQKTVSAAEDVVNTTDVVERYQAEISRRSRAELLVLEGPQAGLRGVDGPTAARTAITFFQRVLGCGLVSEDGDWVRERRDLVMAYARSEGWDA